MARPALSPLPLPGTLQDSGDAAPRNGCRPFAMRGVCEVTGRYRNAAVDRANGVDRRADIATQQSRLCSGMRAKP